MARGMDSKEFLSQFFLVSNVRLACRVVLKVDPAWRARTTRGFGTVWGRFEPVLAVWSLFGFSVLVRGNRGETSHAVVLRCGKVDPMQNLQKRNFPGTKLPPLFVAPQVPTLGGQVHRIE